MFGLYGQKKLLLAFEYALILSQSAQNLEVELSPEIVKKMEEIIIKEFDKSPTRLSVDMTANVLAAFEPK
jgi:hypothetical protein